MTAPSDRNEIYGLETENRHLKDMVGALRDEIEKMRIGEQERLQQSLAAASDEIGQLKKTINALRDEMEKMRIGEHERLQQSLTAASDEIGQLKKMIAALRDELERRNIEYEGQCRAI